MKRKLFFCLVLMFFLSSQKLFCKSQTIKLFVDGSEIKNLPANPIIINDCVLVPVREILERFNADLEWRGDAKELLISKNDTRVLLTVNETVAKVNGEEKILLSPATLINEKLMVPVRFISETFGFEIKWEDGKNERKVIVNQKKETQSKNISHEQKIDDKKNDNKKDDEKDIEENKNCKLIAVRKKNSYEDKYLIETDGNINFGGKIDFVREIFLPGNRLAIDIDNCEVEKNFKVDIVNLKNELLKNVRFSQYKLEPKKIARIVFDLEDGVDYFLNRSTGKIEIELKKTKCNCKNISCENNVIALKKENNFIDLKQVTENDFYDDKKYVFKFGCDLEKNYGDGKFFIRNDCFSCLEIKNSEIIISENKIFAYDIYEDEKNIYIKAVNPKEKYKNILVIDAGHGGNDTGTRNNELNEKDLTFDISQKVLSLFDNDFDRENIKVYATRLCDKKVSLSERVKVANDVGDLFISVHINSSPSNPDANGTEVFYCEQNNRVNKNFCSRDLANVMLKNLIDELKSFNRGVKSNNFYVIKNTEIPAVLCEIGFITNQDEFEKLSSDEYRFKTALAIYNGVKSLLKNYF